MVDKDPQARFWVEAQVAIAKSAILLAAAEADVNRRDYAVGAVSAYYGLFHLSLALIWLLPESLPDKLHASLVEVRDAGKDLPDRLISHKVVERFLCDGQIESPVPGLAPLFRRSLALREFASYGPRVTYEGEDKPVVGPCCHTPQDVHAVVTAAVPLFRETLKAARNGTAYEGLLARISVDGAGRMLDDPQFPFKEWYFRAVIERAAQLLDGLSIELGAATECV